MSSKFRALRICLLVCNEMEDGKGGYGWERFGLGFPFFIYFLFPILAQCTSYNKVANEMQ